MYRLVLLVIFAVCTRSVTSEITKSLSLYNGYPYVFARFTTPYFDCSYRHVQKCPSPATCQDAHCTSCPSGKYGYACHLDSDVADDQGTCKVTCENGGSCLKDETTCQCTPDFTGDKCETPRILLDCGTTYPPDINSIMKIDVSKIIGFPDSHGQVIVEGAASSNINDAVCFGTKDSFTLEVKNDYGEPNKKSASCNAAVYNSKLKTFSRTFIVRFEHGMTLSRTDFIVNATCGGSSKNITLTAKPINNDGQTSSLETVDRSNIKYGPTVTVRLMENGSPLDPSTNYSLSSLIIVQLTMRDDKADFYNDVRLEKMTISNGVKNGKTIDLIENSCPTQYKKSVLWNFYIDHDKRMFLLTSPVMLDGSMINIYTFIVKLCPVDHSGCERVDCTNNKRRKRAVDDNLATLRVGFKVKDETQRSAKNELRNQEECTVSSEITASLVAMAVVILLLLVLVIVLSVRAILARRHDVTVYQHHHLESPSTTSLPKLANGIRN